MYSLYYIFRQEGSFPDNNDPIVDSIFCSQQHIQQQCEQLQKDNGNYFYYIRICNMVELYE